MQEEAWAPGVWMEGCLRQGQKLLSLAALRARPTNKPVSHIKQNLWQREEQRIEFLKHRVQACLFARSEIAGLKDLVLNPVDPVCTEPHTPARRCSAVESRGEVVESPNIRTGCRGYPSGPECCSLYRLGLGQLPNLGVWRKFPVWRGFSVFLARWPWGCE